MPAVSVEDSSSLDRLSAVGAEPRQRPLRSVTVAPKGFEGEGFPVRRVFSGVDLADLDPFIHLDQWRKRMRALTDGAPHQHCNRSTRCNAELRLKRPGLFIRTDGATRDPTPRPKRGPSLRGPRAWALLRTLIEVSPPYTAGQLATALRLDDGYVSRSLQVLLDEQLIERRARGPVTAVEWEPLLRRMIESYTFFGANDTSTWIATAGPDRMLDALDGKRVGRWAVTGSFVTSSIAPVAAPEVAVIYVDDPERLAKAARLLPASTGGNVILAQPYDPIVFHRRREIGRGTPTVSVAQAAIDTLTGHGRMPAEGEALIDWMRRNESRWRSSSLQD